MRESKISNISKYTNTYLKVNKVGAVIGKASYVFSAIDIAKENGTEFFENGAELDDTAVSVASDVAGVLVSAELGGKIGGTIGTALGPGYGTAIGLGVGFVAGGVIGLGYNTLVKPIIIDAYDDYVEPALEAVGDKLNDLGDWWDSLWW